MDYGSIPKWLKLLLAVAVIIIITVVGTLWVVKEPARQKSVSEQWNEAIAQLGIEPVYPPQEDISVGDVFAIITDDAHFNISAAPLPGRSVKIAHIDVTKDIEDAYKETYKFPDTNIKPASPSEIWKQARSDGSLFVIPLPRSELPIVLFPGYTIARVKSFGSGALADGILGSFGSQARSSESVELKIALAETYGIPSLQASGRLGAFCTEGKLRAVCTDNIVRRQLSMLVGDKIYETLPGSNKPRLSVELALVNRVYMTRSIETKINRNTAAAGQVRIGGEGVKGAAGAGEPKADDQPAKDVLGNLKKQLDDQQKEIAQLKKSLEAVSPGAAATIASGHTDEISLTETLLQRPVVFGIRTVRQPIEKPKEE